MAKCLHLVDFVKADQMHGWNVDKSFVSYEMCGWNEF